MAGLYFPHDVNDLADSKLIDMFGELDYYGYGLYYRLICILSNDGEHRLSCNYKRLAKVLSCDAAILERLVTEFGLFTISDDGSQFWSERVLQQCQKLDAAAEAGKKGAAKRWANINHNREAITDPNRVPNSPPNRVPNGVPNGEGITDPNRVPNSPPNRVPNGVPNGEGITDPNAIKTRKDKIRQEKINTADAVLDAAAAEQNLDTQTIAPDVQQLLDAIGKRFDTIPLPAHLTALEALISDCNRPGVVNGVDVVRDGLAKMDTAEAINERRVTLTMTQFLQPKYFMRLLGGDYDKVYKSKRKSNYAGAGVTFEGREY